MILPIGNIQKKQQMSLILARLQRLRKVSLHNNPNNCLASTTNFVSLSVKKHEERWFSSGSGPSIANRKRFYKHVGVVEVSPPWITTTNTASSIPTQESPISAGVDGTQSASGVQGHLKKSQKEAEKKLLLLPKKPVMNPTTNDDSNAIDNLSNNDNMKWYGVTLDGRLLKTPLKQTLAVPSVNLAWSIAAEWDAQVLAMKPTQMPLMTLSCTTLDQTTSNPNVYREMALRYLPTDTTCYWADPIEDYVLHRRQEKAWAKLHELINDVTGYEPAKAVGSDEALMFALRRSKNNGENGNEDEPSTTSNSSGVPHPQGLITACTEFTNQLDGWHLTALALGAAEAKSFLVALAILLQQQQVKSTGSPLNLEELFQLEDAIKASRVEEEFQIENWGLVEGGHDYDRLNCAVQLRSISFMIQAIATDNQL